jgi:K+-sensing histidine kinase KdpD
MQANLFTMLVLIGAMFSLIAAIMAYLISYLEYEKHFIDNKGKARLMSLQAAVVIFVFFMVITIVAAFFFGGQTAGNHLP